MYESFDWAGRSEKSAPVQQYTELSGEQTQRGNPCSEGFSRLSLGS